MFRKKKDTPPIDKDQLELIENAQRRIKQKKGLYIHFVIFLIGALFIIITNTLLGIGKDFKIFDIDWFVFPILLWLLFFLYHVFTVFVTQKFMGKDWEKAQLEKLVAKQQEQIEKLKANIAKEGALLAKSEVQTETKKHKKTYKLTIIAAVAENNAIGKDNALIWHLSDDLKRFKRLTNGHHIIMGRKTFESFPKPLPNRTHVVITKQEHYTAPEGVWVVNNLEDALDVVRNDTQPFIIGGGQIYKQAIGIADKIELTRVHKAFEADTFFPEIDESQWKETANTLHEKNENNEFAFSFITYVRA